MTVVRVKGFQIFADRHGKLRCYHRMSRIAIDLSQMPIGSADFFAECARISALTKASGPPKPGTLGRLVTEYRASPSFLDLAPRTRADYQRCLDYLAPIADTALTKFDRGLIVRIRDTAATKHGRRFGNYVKALLSILFGWGAERGYVASNPAEKVKNVRRQKGSPEANRPWSDHEREAVLEALPPYMRPAIGLMMFTGLGPKDALRLPRTFFKARVRSPLDGQRQGSRCSGQHQVPSETYWTPLQNTAQSPCALTPLAGPGRTTASGRHGAGCGSRWSSKGALHLASPCTGSGTPSQ
jgi:hypothetical protein